MGGRNFVTSRLPAILLGAVAVGMAWRSWTHRGAASASPSEADWASERLRAFEADRRRAANFEKLPETSAWSGPDPYRIVRAPGKGRLLGLLRGDDALVVLDEALHELLRVGTPPSPTALAVSDDESVWVSGELTGQLSRYRWVDAALAPAGKIDLGSPHALRGLAAGHDGWLYLVDEHDSKLIALQTAHHGEAIERRLEIPTLAGPISVDKVGDQLVVDCLLDHAVLIYDLVPGGAPSTGAPIRIVHDGPIWSVAAAPLPGQLVLAAAGVEDHPLDRTVGAFGYVDSFVYLYRIDLTRKQAVRERAINVSELGVVTPKAISLETSPHLVLDVAGYGSARALEIDLSDGDRARVRPLMPGATALVTRSDGARVYANPLLDAWVVDAKERPPEVVPVRATRAAARDPLARLGEALFFSTLMAPFNTSDGPLSRFTCETCHFEGYVDGRTHHTGRGDVHAVTKPLVGLFNNRPYFSRAMDPDLVSVAFNEFRVAGAKSGHDPWFTVTAGDAGWLHELGLFADNYSPEELRKALMAFLMAMNHRPNPSVAGRQQWSAAEREGAVAFRDRCEGCHEARLESDVPSSRVPFERWEELVMSRWSPIVWGKASYEKTGVEPYVHELGARVPSLRRLYKKRPYFTNGSAKTLDEVLVRARFEPGRFWHEAPEGVVGESLGTLQRAKLLRFLDLL